MSDTKTITGKIVTLQASGKYESKSGKNAGKMMYKFEIEVDDGQDIRNANGQLSLTEEELIESAPPMKVGETHTFTIYPSKSENFPDTWYWKKPGAQAGGFQKKAWTPDPNRETPEERKEKQKHITRLACMNTASALIGNGAQGGATPENLIGLATILEKWVYQA